MKDIFLAPLEGIGNHIFRSALTRHYEGITRFYTPFLDVGMDGSMKGRCKKDILPENNKGQKLIPQVLTKYPEAVYGISKVLEAFGYDEININMGCPYKTVISKGKGAAMLQDRERLKRFLDEAFNTCPINISLKIRIGMSDVSEAGELIELFNEYPVKELIIHPRLQKELYDGSIHEDILEYMYLNSKNLVCINPGIKTTEDFLIYQEKYKEASGIMIGRGLISNPQLAENIKNSCCVAETDRETYNKTSINNNNRNNSNDNNNNKAETLDKDRFRAFHDDLLSSYKNELSGDVPVLFKMKELWTYWKTAIPVDEKEYKAIKKSGSINEYKACVNSMLR